MPNDVSPSAEEAARKPPLKSMMDRASGGGPPGSGATSNGANGSHGATGTNGAHGSTSTDGADAADVEESTTVGERAQEMRAGLAIRHRAEALLAEAGELRKRAAADADTMVADAEALARELVAEARAESERTIAAGQERADGIVARARAAAEEIREQTERERDRLREAAAATVRADVDRAHESLSAAAPVLAGAVAAVADVLDAVAALRVDDEPITMTLERLGALSVTSTADPGQVVGDLSEAAVQGVVTSRGGPGDAGAERAEEVVTEDVTTDGPDASLAGEDGRPLGWLFRSGQG